MTAPTCINLLARFGGNYRVSFEEGYSHKWKRRANLDPWRMQIPARFGVIFPVGGDRLGVMVDGHPRVANRLAALPCCRSVQNGAAEQTFEFDVEDFPALAAVVFPWRRQKMAEANRQAASARLRARVLKIPTSSRVPDAPTHVGEKSGPQIVLDSDDL